MERQTCVSAPGKVLITGGYLVLDPRYCGLVLGTSSRFFTNIKTAHKEEVDNQRIIINLSSPQFQYTTEYHFIIENNQSFRVEFSDNAENKNPNPYIEVTLLYCLSMISRSLTKMSNMTLNVELVADNDFYSQRKNLEELNLDVSLQSLESLPKFYSPSTKRDIHKTGLGSSAAMVTSLVACLLSHFEIIKIQSDSSVDMDVVHNMAQFCHCLAQGKIGSGFDVSSATFGSQKYKRFSPSLLDDLLTTCTKTPNKCDDRVVDDLLKLIKHTKWDGSRTPFKLPPYFHLFVADVDQGSNTPNMVRNVLKWRSENPEESLLLWTEIDALNSKVDQCFVAITNYHNDQPELYQEEILQLSNVGLSENSVLSKEMSQLRSHFLKIRSLLKRMGDLAYKEPIEPDQQTDLLDATMNQPCCLIAGVPGAGGFDAIFSILFGNERQVKSQVSDMWIKYQGASVCPLVLNESNVGITNSCIK
ncbi:phosphomevalonate kinase [Acrasis kona]|uniref:phosphomevalonate kinase n=1 Tax=Acrasis kona TaxID=1008807 RepID=A0AAW2ZDV7_9EUKA